MLLRSKKNLLHYLCLRMFVLESKKQVIEQDLFVLLSFIYENTCYVLSRLSRYIRVIELYEKYKSGVKKNHFFIKIIINTDDYI